MYDSVSTPIAFLVHVSLSDCMYQSVSTCITRFVEVSISCSGITEIVHLLFTWNMCRSLSIWYTKIVCAALH